MHADDLTDPAVIAWMSDFKQRVLAARGYDRIRRASASTRTPRLCPSIALPDLFGRASGAESPERVAGDPATCSRPISRQAVVDRDAPTRQPATPR